MRWVDQNLASLVSKGNHAVIQIWTNYKKKKKKPNVLASEPACLLLCPVQRKNCTRALWKPTYLFTDQWLSPEMWSHASKLRFLNLDTQQYRSAVCGLYCECPKGGSLKLNTSWILWGFYPRPMTTVRCSSQLSTMWRQLTNLNNFTSSFIAASSVYRWHLIGSYFTPSSHSFYFLSNHLPCLAFCPAVFVSSQPCLFCVRSFSLSSATPFVRSPFSITPLNHPASPPQWHVAGAPAATLV